MLPHLETEAQITRMRRREALAAAERYRDAQGHSGYGEEQRPRRKIRQQVGDALIRLGRRLQGAQPLEPAAQASAILAASGTGR